MTADTHSLNSLALSFLFFPFEDFCSQWWASVWPYITATENLTRGMASDPTTQMAKWAVKSVSSQFVMVGCWDSEVETADDILKNLWWEGFVAKYGSWIVPYEGVFSCLSGLEWITAAISQRFSNILSFCIYFLFFLLPLFMYLFIYIYISLLHSSQTQSEAKNIYIYMCICVAGKTLWISQEQPSNSSAILTYVSGDTMGKHGMSFFLVYAF